MEHVYCPVHYSATTEMCIDLLTKYPLATLIVASPDMFATMIPLVFDADCGGVLRGHVSRKNPLWSVLGFEGKSTLVVFQGPNAYISPSMYVNKHTNGKVVPTWNYAFVQVAGVARAGECRYLVRSQL
jgi:transcriptional regulator